MWRRLKNLYYLSGLDVSSDYFRQVKLSVPGNMKLPKKKQATIINIEDKKPTNGYYEAD